MVGFNGGYIFVENGGVIYRRSEMDIEFINNYISKNISIQNGGGICSFANGDFSFTNNTVTENASSSFGGGINVTRFSAFLCWKKIAILITFVISTSY